MADRSGKSDMERIGLFQEMSYTTIGDKYFTKAHVYNENAEKGKQLLSGGIKQNSGLQHGYFESKYNRIFEGEGYCDLVANRRRFRKEERKKDIGKPFLPASGAKLSCGKGSFYGTIGGPIAAMSPLLKTTQPPTPPNKNILTSPAKQGSGYGYANITLGPYPPHSVDPYSSAQEQLQAEIRLHKSQIKGGPFKLYLYPDEFFDANPYKMDQSLLPAIKTKQMPQLDLKPFRPSSPGKKIGGAKFGTFDTYPTHSVDVYTDKIKKVVNVMNQSGKVYMPPAGPKTRPIKSLVNQNFLRCMNVMNYRTMTPLTSLGAMAEEQESMEPGK